MPVYSKKMREMQFKWMESDAMTIHASRRNKQLTVTTTGGMKQVKEKERNKLMMMRLKNDEINHEIKQYRMSENELAFFKRYVRHSTSVSFCISSPIDSPVDQIHLTSLPQ